MEEEFETSASSYPGNGNLQIPIDLFVSKKHPQVTSGDLAFADSYGNIVYLVNRRQSPKSSPNNKKLLLDANSNPLLSIYHDHKGSWKCYKGDNNEDKDLVFKVQRTLKTLTRIELEVFLVGEKSEESTCDLKVRGLPFQKSCNIYKNTVLVAQVCFYNIFCQIELLHLKGYLAPYIIKKSPKEFLLIRKWKDRIYRETVQAFN